MTKRRLLLSVILTAMLFSVIVIPTLATKGTGVLYVYEDSGYTTLVHTDEHGFYEVNPGQTVYIKIEGIELIFTWIDVKVSYEDLGGGATYLGKYQVLDPTGKRYVGNPTIPIAWMVPEDAVVCYTYVVQYRNAEDKSSTYIASSPGIHRPSHLHVVPEIPIGTLGAISILSVSYAIYYSLKGRRPIYPLRA